MFSIKGLHESYRAILLTNNIKTKNGLISSKAFFSTYMTSIFGIRTSSLAIQSSSNRLLLPNASFATNKLTDREKERARIAKEKEKAKLAKEKEREKERIAREKEKGRLAKEKELERIAKEKMKEKERIQREKEKEKLAQQKDKERNEKEKEKKKLEAAKMKEKERIEKQKQKEKEEKLKELELAAKEKEKKKKEKEMAALKPKRVRSAYMFYVAENFHTVQKDPNQDWPCCQGSVRQMEEHDRRRKEGLRRES